MLWFCLCPQGAEPKLFPLSVRSLLQVWAGPLPSGIHLLASADIQASCHTPNGRTAATNPPAPCRRLICLSSTLWLFPGISTLFVLWIMVINAMSHIPSSITRVHAEGSKKIPLLKLLLPFPDVMHVIHQPEMTEMSSNVGHQMLRVLWIGKCWHFGIVFWNPVSTGSNFWTPPQLAWWSGGLETVFRPFPYQRKSYSENKYRLGFMP